MVQHVAFPHANWIYRGAVRDSFDVTFDYILGLLRAAEAQINASVETRDGERRFKFRFKYIKQERILSSV